MNGNIATCAALTLALFACAPASNTGSGPIPLTWQMPVGRTQGDFNRDAFDCAILARTVVGPELADYSWIKSIPTEKQQLFMECLESRGYSPAVQLSSTANVPTGTHCGGGPGLPTTCR